MKPNLRGWGHGLAGVVIFSGSLPATRVAINDFSPLFLTGARAVLAALLAGVLLLAFRAERPQRSDLGSLVVVAMGVVVGFPLLTALALEHVTAGRTIVFSGILPLVTAAFAFVRGGERPRPAYWLFSAIGAAAVALFALTQSGGSSVGDLFMAAAVVVCGLGYAEGAMLARRIGGWQVISWALVLSIAPMAAVAATCAPQTFSHVAPSSMIALGYVSAFSMLIGFVFWYRRLAIGGVASVGQLQLLQPFFGLGLAGFLLGEPIAPQMIGVALVVIACVAAARRFA